MSISAMNNVIRDNRNLLKRTTGAKFAHIPGKYAALRKEKYDHVILKPQVLKNIRVRLQNERKQLLKRRIVAFFVIVVLLIGSLLL